MVLQLDRLKVFLRYGVKCSNPECTVEGKWFQVDRHGTLDEYDLNLYGYNDEGHFVLMTCDHIIPLAMGGKNKMDNYQPLCLCCNQTKGNKEINYLIKKGKAM